MSRQEGGAPAEDGPLLDYIRGLASKKGLLIRTERTANLSDADKAIAANRVENTASAASATNTANDKAPDYIIVGDSQIEVARKADTMVAVVAGAEIAEGCAVAPEEVAAVQAEPAAERDEEGRLVARRADASSYTIDRVLIAVDPKNRRRKLGALERWFNGFIMSSSQGRAIAVPPPAMLYYEHLDDVSRRRLETSIAAGEAFIQPIFNGTTVTLYYYNRRWCIGSRLGYDISCYKQMGEITYAEALFEVLSMYPLFATMSGLSYNRVSGRLGFNNLSADFCYSVGFRHHALHPCGIDPPKAWLLAIHDTSGSLPRPMNINAIGGASMHIPRQRLSRPTVSAAAYNLYGETSVSNAVSLMMGKMPAIGDFNESNGGLSYGYLIATPAETVLIEFPLYSAVREMVYAPPASLVAPADRMRYNAARAATKGQQALFSALFPEWAEWIAKVSKFLEEVISAVHLELVGSSIGAASAAASAARKAGADKVPTVIARHLIGVIHKTDPNFKLAPIKGNPAAHKSARGSSVTSNAMSVVRDLMRDSQFVAVCMHACK